MFENIISPEQQQTLHQLLADKKRIVLTCHISPDGDAIGSMTAMASVLQRLGHDTTCICPDNFPDFLMWIPGAKDMLVYNRSEQRTRAEQVLREADLVCMMDHNATSRMNELGAFVDSLTAPRIMIDHHPNPDTGCAVTISRPDMCAACEVLFRLMWQMGWASDMTLDEAISIYTGMMTDTGAFTYNSNRPEVFEIIAKLIARGINKDRIYRNVFWTQSADRLRLTGFLLYVNMQILDDYHASIITFNNKERRHFQTRNGDTEGIVNMPLQVAGMKLSIFLRQDTENPQNIRVSLRSVDDFPCNEMSARYFNGGGHLNAAGGRLTCSMDQAVEIAKRAIKDFEAQLRA